MKTINLNILIVLLLNSFCLTSQNNCENFDFSVVVNDDNGVDHVDNWTGNNAQLVVTNPNSVDGTNYLRMLDLSGSSWVYNNVDYSGNLIDGSEECSFCWDFRMFNDGEPNSIINTNPAFYIYSGTSPTFANLRAKFTATNVTINENSDWVRICAPIKIATNTLPANNDGAWSINSNDPINDWNTLISDASGVTFRTDLTSNTTEIFGVDNFCYFCCNESFLPEFSIEINCAENSIFEITATTINPNSNIYTWELYEVPVQGQTTNGILKDTKTGNSSEFSLNFSNYNGKHFYIKLYSDDCPNIFKSIAVPEFPGEPIFHFEDANGNEKSHFCYGEEIYLDGRDSYGESGYHISAVRRPIAGGAYTWFGGPGWILPTSPVTNIENLSYIYAHLTDPPYSQGFNKFFEPGYVYKINFAIADVPNCVGWRVTSKTFTVECCEDILSAEFKLEDSDETNDGTYTLFAIDYNPYLNTSVQHEWYVYIESGGDLDLLDVQLGSNLSFNGAKDGINYVVVHKIITPCGEFCFGQAKCNNCGGFFDEGCELCGPIDCDILDEYCGTVAPVDLYCTWEEGILQLHWDKIPGAKSYRIEIRGNGPECNNPPYGDVVEGFEVETNSFDVPNDVIINGCFTWFITAVCSNGEVSEHSEVVIFNGEECMSANCETVPPKYLNLDCENEEYSWQGVSDAIGYIIEFTYNGGLACCESKYLGEKETFYVEDNSLPLEAVNWDWDCGSWRVRSICENEVLSEWSEPECLLHCVADVGDLRSSKVEEEFTAEIYPNPNDGQMTVRLGGNSGKEIKVNIYSLNGKLVKTLNKKTNNGIIDLDLKSIIQSGIYLLNIQSAKGVVNKKVIIE